MKEVETRDYLLGLYSWKSGWSWVPWGLRVGVAWARVGEGRGTVSPARSLSTIVLCSSWDKRAILCWSLYVKWAFFTKFNSFTWKPNKGAEPVQPHSSARRTAGAALGENVCRQWITWRNRPGLAISLVGSSTWGPVHLGAVLQPAVFVEMKWIHSPIEERRIHIRGRGKLSAVSGAKEVEKSLHKPDLHEATIWVRLPE